MGHQGDFAHVPHCPGSDQSHHRCDPQHQKLKGNKTLILEAWQQGKEQGADLVVTPELALVGYPPKDLVDRKDLLAVSGAALAELARETADGPGLIVGAPFHDGTHVFNAAWLLDKGKIQAHVSKYELPNYGPFDDKRIFQPGELGEVINFRGHKLGVMICEDTWFPTVARHLAAQGAEMLISINASPFQPAKHGIRIEVVVKKRVAETGLSLLYVNQMVGIDGLVFDGSSFVMNADRRVAFQGPAWECGLFMTEWDRTEKGFACRTGMLAPIHGDMEALYRALVLGTRDYIRQNDFRDVVLGLSGGVDSALVAVIAADALGGEHVHCLRMPTKYTSAMSMEDAERIAHNIGAALYTVDIEPVVESFLAQIAPLRRAGGPSVTEENLQARIRGTTLMAFSNEHGSMVLTTGNKSEIATGYSTLYGDMNGGFNPLKDVYKTQVYKLVEWRNAHKPQGLHGPNGMVIPANVSRRAPAAELRPDQTDQENLPPYDILDDILLRFVEKGETVSDIVAAGYDCKTVDKIWWLLNSAEYKRQQAAPGVMVSGGEFTRVYRQVISNRFAPDQMPGQVDAS